MKTRQLLRTVCWALLAGSLAWAAGPTDDEVGKMTLAAPDKAPAKPARPRKVLVLSLNLGFKHTAIPYGARAIEVLGKKTGAFEAVESHDLADLAPAKLAGFDALVLNNGYQFKIPDPAMRQGLLDFVRNGKGIVGIHAASANFEGWPEGTQLLGARFHSHPWTAKADWAFRNEAPDHPLNAAFEGKGFRLKDEMYTYTEFAREKVKTLVSLDLSDPVTGGVAHPHPYVPVSWIYELGKGRVFFCSLGHEHAIFWTPAYLRHLLAGLQFALGDLAADASPDKDVLYRSLTDPAQSRVAFRAMEREVGEAGNDPARRAAIEAKLLGLVKGDASVEQKRVLAEPLSWVASNASVPVVTPWLTNAELAHGARQVLERVATPEAIGALRAALVKVDGKLEAGLIGSLAVLGDRASVAAITPSLAAADPAVASAAARALGRLGGSEAAKALRAAALPAALRPVLDDALADCAARLVAEGQPAQAEGLYATLVDAQRPTRTRALGLRGLVAARSPQAGPLVSAWLTGDDPVLASTAARSLDRVADEAVVAKAVAACPKLSPALQAMVITALGDRGTEAVGPLALAALGSDNADLRRAAIRALGGLGRADAVLPLARIAATGARDEQPLAVNALVGLRGKPAEDALLAAAAKGETDTRVALLGALALRKLPAALPVMVAAASDADAKVAVAAVRALLKVGQGAQVPALVKVIVSTGDEAVRDGARGASVAVIRREPDRDKAVQPVVDALPGAPAAGRQALLDVLGEVGGPVAMAALAKAAESPDAALRAAALRSLCESTEDPAALPALLRMARQGADQVKQQALRGWLRVLAAVGPSDPAGVVAQLRQGLDLLRTAKDKKLALGAVREARCPAAVALAGEWIADPEVAGDAILAVRALTSPQGALKPVTGPEADAALDKVAALKDAHLPKPWRTADVGQVAAPGAAVHKDGKWTLDASGADFFGAADGGVFIHQRASGDVSVTARVLSIKRTDPWAKAGVMIRATTDAGSVYAGSLLGAGNQGVFQWRPAARATTEYTVNAQAKPPYWVRLTRVGNLLTSMYSPDGKAWTKFAEQQLALPADVLVGIAASAHNMQEMTQAVIENVEVGKP